MKTTTMMAAIAIAAMPVLATAQSTGQGQSRPDSTQMGTMTGGQQHQGHGGTMQRGRQQGTHRSTAGGRRATTNNRSARGANMGLTRDQVMELQAALTNGGCDAGTADGTIGPRTRRAIACARKQHEISGNDMGALYSALGLSFGSEGSDAGTSGNGNASSTGTGSNTNRPANSTGTPTSPPTQPPTQSTEPVDSTTRRPPGTPS